MGAYTPRANLYKPGGGSTGLIVPDETVDIDKLNANFDKLDALLGARNIPSASSYAGTMDGDLVFAQDTEYLHMYSASAAALVTPRLPGARMFSGTRAEREAFAAARTGDLWRDTDNIGIIWAFKAGSPGTWEYSGNKCRGTKAAIDQTATDGIAVAGMWAYCVDEDREYVRKTAWEKQLDLVRFVVPFVSANTGVSAPVYYGSTAVNYPSPRAVAPVSAVAELYPTDSSVVQWAGMGGAPGVNSVGFRLMRIGAYPGGGTAMVTLGYA